MDEWSKDIITNDQKCLLGGKTPLHLACSRYDDFKVSYKIASLLLQYNANPNLICNGHTSLTLAIATGNDLIVSKLLIHDKLNVNLPLTHGLGNSICVVCSTIFEHSWTIEDRIALIKKMIYYKADLLSLVAIGPKRILGSAIDYAYYMYNMDQRVSRLPYHALSSIEREQFDYRKTILSSLGMLIRETAHENEKLIVDSINKKVIENCGQSHDFASINTDPCFNIGKKTSIFSSNIPYNPSNHGLTYSTRTIFKYCYECGRSCNVILTLCMHCKKVYFCSKFCYNKSWSARHKLECITEKPFVVKSKYMKDKILAIPTSVVTLDNLSFAKDILELPNTEGTRQNKKISKDVLELSPQMSQSSRKLSPLHLKAYATDDRLRYDQQDYSDKTISTRYSDRDNYSFQ